MTLSTSEDLATALDHVLFAQMVGIDPDGWQRKVLLSNDKQMILNCSRQSGKPTVVALVALHHAVVRKGALVLLLSPSMRQSAELFKKVVVFYHKLGQPVPIDVETTSHLQLTNRSRIVSLPGQDQTVRGFSGPSLLIIDEAARVADDLYYAARPMLAASNGRIILLSTPCGKRGFFFRVWTHGEDWLKVKVNADQCPRIARSFLDQERLALGDRWYAQEYFCVFEESEAALFSVDVVERAVKDFPQLEIDLDELD